MYHGPIIILIIMSSIKELRTDFCLEHYKGPVACRVQYSLSAECACPTENSIIFLLGICKKKKTVGNCEFGITWIAMVVGIHLNARRFRRAETKATAG